MRSTHSFDSGLHGRGAHARGCRLRSVRPDGRLQQRGGACRAAHRRRVQRAARLRGRSSGTDTGSWFTSRLQPRLLERIEPFVQIVFEPADALPARVSEEIDLDGDGRPDVRVSFTVPADPNAPMRGDVTALNGKYISLMPM